MPRKKKADEAQENEQTEEVVELKGKELETAAEAESTDGTEAAKALEEKRKKILEKAKKLAEGVDVTELEDLKKQVKGEKKTEMLVPLEEYIRSGVYIGTKVVTPNMWEYVHRRRADGLAIFNTDLIDAKIKEAVEYLSQFQPNEVILVCKRQAGWKAAEMFSQLTGIRTFTKKYPAGILTNLTLPDFFENELTIVCDAWVDKNALNDTLRVKKKVLMICDTNNFTKGADKIVIGNNKSSRSLGLIFYLLTKGYCEKKGIEKDIPELNFWIGDKGEAEDEARRKAKIGAKYGV